jgi:hypothetical protein
VAQRGARSSDSGGNPAKEVMLAKDELGEKATGPKRGGGCCRTI